MAVITICFSPGQRDYGAPAEKSFHIPSNASGTEQLFVKLRRIIAEAYSDPQIRFGNTKDEHRQGTKGEALRCHRIAQYFLPDPGWAGLAPAQTRAMRSANSGARLVDEQMPVMRVSSGLAR